MPIASSWDERRALLWEATHALRQAEELAKLSAEVSGPADAPPKEPSGVSSYVADWKRRAKEALKRAHAWRLEKQEALQRRGAEVARRIQEGARRIRQASPAEAAKEGIAELAQHAGGIAAWTFIGHGLGLLIALWLAYEFLWKGK